MSIEPVFVLRSVPLLASAILLTACTSSDSDVFGSAQGYSLAAEVQHVHGIVANPSGDGLILGTHQGVFYVSGSGEVESVGPVLDFMGFSDAGQGRLVASGHPGPDTDMPDPVGLIESTDGGHTWEPLSRVGVSDFHALAATEGTVIGFDDALRATDDGQEWYDLDPKVQQVMGLAVSEDAEIVLATTQDGLRRSEDGGRSFVQIDGTPPLVFIDWVPGTDEVYGIDVGGTVHRSEDTGKSWESRGAAGEQPEALHADVGQIVVAVDGTLVMSSDEGQTFDEVNLKGS